MKKIIILLALCFILQGCIFSYGSIKYETSNTVALDIKVEPEKQTFNLFISARDQEQFKEITNNIVKYLKEWRTQ